MEQLNDFIEKTPFEFTFTKSVVVLRMEYESSAAESARAKSLDLLKLNKEGFIEHKTYSFEESSFSSYAPEIKSFIEDCAIWVYNDTLIEIDILREEFRRLGVYVDLDTTLPVNIRDMFTHVFPSTLEFTLNFLNAKHEHFDTELHKIAFVGTVLAETKNFTIEQVSEKSAEFSEFIKEVDGKKVFAFGKYHDVPVKEVFTKDRVYILRLFKFNTLSLTFKHYLMRLIHER